MAYHRFLLSQRLIIPRRGVILDGASVDERSHKTTTREAPVLLSSSIPVVSPFLKIGAIHFDEPTGERGRHLR